MSLHHTFSVEYTQLYGMDCAVMIHHFQYWVEHNRMMKKNFIDGRTWTFQTQKEIAALYPYWSEDTVQRTISKLLEFGVLIKANYNKSKIDKTSWYAFKNEETFTIPQKRGIAENITRTNSNTPQPVLAHSAKTRDGCREIAECNKDNIQYTELSCLVCEAAPPEVKKTTKDGKFIKISKNDLLDRRNLFSQDWTTKELDQAWEAFANYTGKIGDWFPLIEGILKNIRKQNTFKNSQEKKCQSTQKTKQKKHFSSFHEGVSKPSEASLDRGTRINPFLEFISPKPLKDALTHG